MNTQDKELLLKDLCARLPYKVIVHIKLNHNIHNLEYNSLLHGFMLNENVGISQLDGYTKFINLNEDEVKPYLRPMSSMTEKEFKEYHNMLIDVDNSGLMNQKLITKIVDWLDEKMFDHRNLIPKGLALEASKEMYKN